MKYGDTPESSPIEGLYDKYQTILASGGCGHDLSDFPWLEIECECYSCQLARDMEDIINTMGEVEL